MITRFSDLHHEERPIRVNLFFLFQQKISGACIIEKHRLDSNRVQLNREVKEETRSTV